MNLPLVVTYCNSKVCVPQPFVGASPILRRSRFAPSGTQFYGAETPKYFCCKGLAKQIRPCNIQVCKGGLARICPQTMLLFRSLWSRTFVPQWFAGAFNSLCACSFAVSAPQFTLFADVAAAAVQIPGSATHFVRGLGRQPPFRVVLSLGRPAQSVSWQAQPGNLRVACKACGWLSNPGRLTATLLCEKKVGSRVFWRIQILLKRFWASVIFKRQM